MAFATPITDVFAEHGFGLCRYSGYGIDRTFLFADADKREQLGWVDGHLSDGAIIPGPTNSERRRIHLIVAAQARKAA